MSNEGVPGVGVTILNGGVPVGPVNPIPVVTTSGEKLIATVTIAPGNSQAITLAAGYNTYGVMAHLGAGSRYYIVDGTGQPIRLNDRDGNARLTVDDQQLRFFDGTLIAAEYPNISSIVNAIVPAGSFGSVTLYIYASSAVSPPVSKSLKLTAWDIFGQTWNAGDTLGGTWTTATIDTRGCKAWSLNISGTSNGVGTVTAYYDCGPNTALGTAQGIHAFPFLAGTGIYRMIIMCGPVASPLYSINGAGATGSSGNVPAWGNAPTDQIEFFFVLTSGAAPAISAALFEMYY